MSVSKGISGLQPTNLLRAFECVCLLNLPNRTDRLRESFATLERIDPAARRLVRVVPGVRATEAEGFPSVGAYGCFLTHLSALRLAHSCGVRSVLILEDDLCVHEDMRNEWTAISQALLTHRWDIVNLGFHPDFNRSTNRKLEPLFPTDEPLSMAHCYAVSGAALPSLIKYLEAILLRPAGHPRGGPMHYDGALYHYLAEHPGTVRLRLGRSLVSQRSSRSDISVRRWFDRNLALLRPIISTSRSLRNRLR